MSAPAVPGARLGLLVLTGINLLNYLDRYVVSAVLESLRRSPLHPSDAQLGLLGTAFLIVYTVAAPLFGRLGDTGRRPRALAAGVALWSAATALGGLAWSYASLFVTRAFVGVGEAAYGTIAPSLLADYFPLRQRGRAFAIFFVAIPVGAALGYMVGGLVDHHYGWRAAFFVAGVPGLILAALTLRLPDPPRGHQESQSQPPSLTAPAARVAFAALVRNRAYRLTVLGYAAYTFALGGIAWWMAPFLQRVRGLSGPVATVRFGAVVVVTGLVGTYAGGWLGDRLLARSRQAYLWLSGAATLAAAPLFALALLSPAPAVYWGAMAAAELLMFASTGPINSMIVNVVSPGMRATAVALSIFTIHAAGDVWSPVLVGKISDLHSLGAGVLILPCAALVAGVVWTYAAATPASPPA
jgi:MFS transporter, Spinster family, sphingosine-1-phosphate transporter